MKRRFLLTAERQELFMFAVCLCALMPAAAFGLSESTGPGGSNVQAVHALGYEGQNVNIGFISLDNLLVSHEAFYEKDINGLPTGPQHAFVYDKLGFGINATNHDTELAGIIVSNGGQSHPDQIGVAPKADLHNIRVGTSGSPLYSSDLETTLDELIVNQNCRVIVTGIALFIDGNGQSIWSKIYDYYAQTYDVLFANAAGNHNESYPNITTVNAFGDAYNGITTAGIINTSSTAVYDKVGSLSLPGPTTDGRQKPDVAAPSSYQTVPSSASNTSWATVPGNTQGYTSWSVPHTAGVAALLLNYAETTTTEPDDGHSEVIKAVIVNSTFPNIISKDGTPTTGLTWQADRGYGRLDALRAFETLSSGRVYANSSSLQQKGWAFESIKRNQTHTFTITAQRNQRLVTTITWHRKLNSSFVEENPRFYVNMQIISLSSGSTIVSNAAGPDNLIKTDVLLEQGGQYQIIINNAPQLSYRNYALAFELISPLVGDFNVDYVVNDLDLVDFVPYWLETDCLNTAQPCFDYNLSLSDAIDLSDFSIFALHWLDYDNRYYSP